MKYDYEERALFWTADALGITIDAVYSSRVLMFLIKLSANLGGISVRRPR